MFRREDGCSSMQSSTPTVTVTDGAEYDAQIEDTARGGDGIARVEGFVVFVPGTEVGNQVRSQVDLAMQRGTVDRKV